MTEHFSAVVEARCRQFADRVAVHDVTAEAISYRSLFAAVLSFAASAQDAGVKAGDLVAIDMADATAGNILRLALLRLGATLINGRRSAIASKFGLEPAWGFQDAPPEAIYDARDVTVEPGWIRPPARPIPISGAGALVSSSSGTTGLPKLRLMTGATLLARLTRADDRRGAPAGPSLIGYRPASSPGFNHFLRCLLAGVAAVPTRATPAESLRDIRALGVTDAYLSPFNFNQLLAAVEADQGPLPLQRIVVGGGALDPKTAARAEALVGCAVFNTYGSSETSGIARFQVTRSPDQSGVVGRVADDMEVKFVQATGMPADPRTGGEIMIRVPPEIQVLNFPGGSPVCDEDGWVATGDIGQLLADGRLRLTGRKSELLNIGGSKHAPSFFEDLAMDQQGIRRAVAFAVPAGGGTEHVGLAVEVGAGFDLRAFGLRMQHLLGPTYPLQIGVVDDFATTPAGKVDRRRLGDIFAAAHRERENNILQKTD
ncbi:MAG: AMP-binding protein [Limimaricola sp.]|uniref:class I adenylate-forming enzyme family protein n=1 Tax=Limimaricola sp. TaxID=2211665 RepID=UPI001D21AEDE|nr:class I adenylate-forming enzyme family protein [Limimaricola sp.]MBI1417862.1 AMP-binding protein [Limimaricola sp.]